MTKSITITLALLALAIFALAGVLLFKPIHQAYGSAFTGQASYLQVATTTTVNSFEGPAATTLFSLRSDGACKARVITTTISPIMISFGDTTGFGSTTITGQAGHWQAASTTVVYDGGLYGCGRMTARSFGTSTVTTSEF